ncbi:MAG: polysaccharide deacetylase family protein [Chitinophagaceae bacterium]|nr:polysaccharide deacetylase family protein [Chitinophagaceae bacterium]
MILFVHTITSRHRFIARFLEQELTNAPVVITADKETYLHETGPRINYSDERITGNEFWLKPAGLLSENTIAEQVITVTRRDGLPFFFPTEGDFEFDIFSVIFYLLSRYEEYLPHTKDIYGRYAHVNSLAFKEGFLDQPLVNQWMKIFARALEAKFPDLKLRKPLFSFIPTYDIDEAWAFKHKTWTRSAGGALRDLITGHWKRLARRRRVLNNKEADPYDAVAWMDDLHRPSELKPRYFFLVAEQNGKYDKNELPSETAMQTIIQHHAEKYAVGLHPSWQSGDDSSLLPAEKARLEKISGLKITASRQHYIRFSMPESFRRLLEAGMTEDYSMGYGSINGFRASVASPFFWFDLEKNAETHLQLFPFCYMDANSYYEQGQDAAGAYTEMKNYYEKVKAVDGLFISIWHNTFLGTEKRFEGWKEAYRTLFNSIS